MSKAKYLIKSSLNNLISHYKEKTEVNSFKWQIRKGKSKERYEKIKKYSYVTNFIKEFDNIFPRKSSPERLISYFDTLKLMSDLQEHIDSSISKNLDVFMEFEIPFSINQRIDYLIAFKNTLVLVEFSKTESFKPFEIYNQKHLQVIQYENLLSNIISSHIKTIPYVIVFFPEYDTSGIEIEKNIKKNSEKIKQLADLVTVLYENDVTASEEIVKLSK